MKLVVAFFKLIRWPNLLFIALTQCLFFYTLIIPVFSNYQIVPILSPQLLGLIVLSSVLIAAAGYIINDYFDLNIDTVNKPDKLVVEKIINRRWVMLWHWVLSVLGIALSFIVFKKMLTWFSLLVAIINILCVVALWLYSTIYKKKLLVGNILIALLTSWTILILYLININTASSSKFDYSMVNAKIFKYTILYAGFAFIISLIREAIKDIEDREGDEQYGCQTMPIVWGIATTKVYIAVWLIVLMGALIIILFYALQLGWWLGALYCMLTLIAPLVWILQNLYRAKLSSHYHRLSIAIKWLIFFGILSLIFLKAYA